MLDYIFKLLWLSNYFEKFRTLEVEKLKQETRSEFEHVEKSTELVVVFPGWKSGGFVSNILKNKIIKSQKSFLLFSFPPEILSPDPQITVKAFFEIKSKACTEIKKLKEEYGFQKVNLIASSLGAVSALMIANGNEDINEISLIVSGSCLASSLWDGIRTQKLRNIYEKNGITREKLEAMWATIAPKNNINALDNKKLFIAVSEADKVIPYKYGKELLDLIQEKYPTVIPHTNQFFGHYGTLAYQYLTSRFIV